VALLTRPSDCGGAQLLKNRDYTHHRVNERAIVWLQQTQWKSLVLLVLAKSINYRTGFHAGDADKSAQRDPSVIT
jgi:hypothetical protein